MDENLTCDVCSSEYDVSNVVPKVLQCGHTFCLPCVTKIVQNTSICPNCRLVINGDVNSLPTNYSVLGIVESYKSIKNLDSHVVCSFDIMKSKYLQRKDNLSKKKSKIESSLEVIENGLAKLCELTDSDQEIDTRKARKILTKLEEEYKKSEDFVRFNYWKIKLSVSISLRSFGSPEKYLTEIYNRVQNKENVFSVCQIKDQITYGEISLYENKLFFHSLSLSEVPKESSLIWFDELKQCVNYKNFSTFMKICCNEKKISRILIFKMLPYEKSHHFIKLCTGEYGPSYKGASFEKGVDDKNSQSILIVPNFIEDGHQCSRAIDYNFTEINCVECGFECEENQMYLFMDEENFVLGIFIAKHNNVYMNIIGKVISPTNLSDSINYDHSSFLKIVDCGIIVEVF